MIRRASFAALVTGLLILAFGAVPRTSAPIKLARHPDYHAGKIAFSYLGDIWTANEDGSDRRIASPTTAGARSIRASRRTAAGSRSRRTATATTTCSSSPATGGTPRRLTFHTGNDDVVGWTRDSQQVLFRAARGDGAFPNVATLYQMPVGGGLEQPLPVDWGYWGNFSPDGKSLVFNRHPAVWSRQHYRGSYAADLWIADLDGEDLHEAARRRALQPLLADVGRRRRDLLRRRSAAERQERQAGQPRGPQERQQHLQDSRRTAGSRCRSRNTSTATCSGRRCRATAR